MLDKLTLVLGGAGSGKSLWAETLVRNACDDRVYLATARTWDDEMRQKVARHRDQRGDGWTTIEAPLDVAAALAQARSDQVVLLDCATMWLSNHLLEDSDLMAEEERFLAALDTCKAPVVVVSNEVGMSVVPENALARRFRDAQGALNQKLATQAGLVVAVMAGLPLALKGRLP
ncbi:bifunctional adenosylcobinamide kinase/adenosylcobinamide-phosphate guanylyltransferase [Thalassovita sp.]|uniref:bifunctional adenosylcobinamide kinase/adenosylcobinamide-phosphate guanylyltransferase n=1 Tax=Thalassovita sp. TaxID=1979401 RepID=UPI0029DE5E82|nr:bifunctional adenosylcobinamide kinase/adenosylcobinamide-phosphate guanylyltransferase [Thalassovita sp.]